MLIPAWVEGLPGPSPGTTMSTTALTPNPGGDLSPEQVVGRDELIRRFWEILETRSLVHHAPLPLMSWSAPIGLGRARRESPIAVPPAVTTGRHCLRESQPTR